MLARISEHFHTISTEYPGRTGAVFLLTACRIAADIIAPLLFVSGLDSLKDDNSDEAIWEFSIFAGLLLASQIIPHFQEKLLIPMGTSLSAQLMEEAGETFFMIPETVASQESGETHELVNHFGGSSQPGAVAFSLFPVTLDFATGLFELIALNAYMWSRLGKITLPNTLQAVLFLAACGPMAKNIAEKFVDYINYLYRGFSHTIVFANEYIPNILFNQQAPALNKLKSFIVDELNPRTQKTLNTNANSLLMPSVLGNAALIGQLAWAAHNNLLTADEFILLVFYSQTHTNVTRNLTRRLIEGISSWGLFVKLLQYIDKASVSDTKQFTVESKNADIEFEGVAYTHPKASAPAFEGASFTVKPGEVVALKGVNGSGKSTMFKMLYGFAKPEKGRILLGGQDITELNPNSMRAVCAFVPQKPNLLPRSFKTNINCRCPEASDSEINKVMLDVGLSPKFNLNQDIEFGFDGPKISGGERQRVIIARALLEIRTGKIKYLFFDEGLASLDAAGEDLVLTTLRDAIKKYNITTIIITHHLKRLEEVIKFDNVIDMAEFRAPAHVATSESGLFKNLSPENSVVFHLGENEIDNKEALLANTRGINYKYYPAPSP